MFCPPTPFLDAIAGLEQDSFVNLTHGQIVVALQEIGALLKAVVLNQASLEIKLSNIEERKCQG